MEETEKEKFKSEEILNYHTLNSGAENTDMFGDIKDMSDRRWFN